MSAAAAAAAAAAAESTRTTRDMGLAARRGQPRPARGRRLRRARRTRRRGRPSVCRQEQRLGQEAADITSAVSASSSSEEQLRDRLKARTRQVAGLGSRFVG